MYNLSLGVSYSDYCGLVDTLGGGDGVSRLFFVGQPDLVGVGIGTGRQH